MRTLSNKQTIEALKNAGINIKEYKRGPLGKTNVSLAKTQDGNGLRVWFPDCAEYRVSTNKRKQQAVLVVKEPPREVKNELLLDRVDFQDQRGLYDSIMKKRYMDTPYEKVCEQHTELKSLFSGSDREVIRENLSVFVPNSRFIPQKVSMGHDWITFFGISKTRTTTTCFLIGVDENKHFVSVLKKPVETVAQAHEELRPKNISPNAKRHGEWFFDPVPEKEAERVFEKAGFCYMELENGSTHRGQICHYGGEQFAFGIVKDSRKNYHKPLYLNSLHKVVRNNERKLVDVRNYD